MRVGVPVTIGTLRVSLTAANRLELQGTLADDATLRELRAQLATLQDGLVAQKFGALAVDVRSLTFVTSSALRLFVDMASRAETDGYTILFDIDSAITWHRLSFSVLQTLAPERVLLRDARAGAA
jgi:anti-anti-sigma regulatory factor